MEYAQTVFYYMYPQLHALLLHVLLLILITESIPTLLLLQTNTCSRPSP